MYVSFFAYKTNETDPQILYPTVSKTTLTYLSEFPVLLVAS